MNEVSTACYRGFIATWLLENDALFLKKLDTEPWPDEPGKDIPIVNVFPTAPNQVFASWVTAQIRIPQGTELPFHHDGVGSNFERDLYVTITNGVVESQHERENIGEAALLSYEHMKWILSADEPVDDGKSYLWDDARDVATDIFYKEKIKYKHSFRTRGFFRKREQTGLPGIIYVPETRLTPYVSFSLYDVPKDYTATNGIPVEVKVKFIPDKYYHEDLKVESIRPLKPGEAIHHPYFKIPMHQIGL